MNAALCLFVYGMYGMATTDPVERKVGRNVLKTLTQCGVILDCRQTQGGPSCYMHRNQTGKHLKLNSRTNKFFHLIQPSQQSPSTKSNMTNETVPYGPKRLCSCKLPGYGTVNTQTKYLFTVSRQGPNNSVYLHEPSNLSKKIKLDMNFDGQPIYLFPVINRCQFLWMPEMKQQFNSMCFDGKKKSVIFKGDARCGYYDHLRGLHFFWEYQQNSTTLKVFADDKYEATIITTIHQYLECRCFSGNAESQTIAYCTIRLSGIDKWYHLHTINYRNLDRIKPRRVLTFPSNCVYTAVVSEDAVALQQGRASLYRVYIYNSRDNIKTYIGKCPFPSIRIPSIGMWNEHVYIKCTYNSTEYYYFYTRSGRKTAEMKAEIGTLLAVGLA